MGCLSHDGVDDGYELTTLASALANVSDGAWTVGALVKFADLGHFSGIAYLLTGAGAGTTEAGLSNSSTTNGPIVDVNSGYPFGDTVDISSTANPYMLVCSKGAGAVAPRIGIKLGVGGSWVHADSVGGTLADQVAAVQLQIGMWEEGDFFEGHLGVIAFWEGAMSDGNKEALDDNWRTSDWWLSAHGQPEFLMEFNVAAASVVDLAGNASSLTVIGAPTLDAGETLNSWNFDGTGIAVTPAVDIDVTDHPKYLMAGRSTV